MMNTDDGVYDCVCAWTNDELYMHILLSVVRIDSYYARTFSSSSCLPVSHFDTLHFYCITLDISLMSPPSLHLGIIRAWRKKMHDTIKWKSPHLNTFMCPWCSTSERRVFGHLSWILLKVWKSGADLIRLFWSRQEERLLQHSRRVKRSPFSDRNKYE